MAAEWYYESRGIGHGPLSASELKRLAQTGKILPDALVKKGVEGKWVRAERVRGLFEPIHQPSRQEADSPSELAGPPPLPRPLREEEDDDQKVSPTTVSPYGGKPVYIVAGGVVTLVILLAAASIVVGVFAWPDTHKKVAADMLELQTELNDLLSTVEDEASANKAAAKLKALTKKEIAIRTRMEELGDPPPDIDKALTEKYGKQLERELKRTRETLDRIYSDPEIRRVISEAFGEPLRAPAESKDELSGILNELEKEFSVSSSADTKGRSTPPPKYEDAVSPEVVVKNARLAAEAEDLAGLTECFVSDATKAARNAESIVKDVVKSLDELSQALETQGLRAAASALKGGPVGEFVEFHDSLFAQFAGDNCEVLEKTDTTARVNIDGGEYPLLVEDGKWKIQPHLPGCLILIGREKDSWTGVVAAGRMLLDSNVVAYQDVAARVHVLASFKETVDNLTRDVNDGLFQTDQQFVKKFNELVKEVVESE